MDEFPGPGITNRHARKVRGRAGNRCWTAGQRCLEGAALRAVRGRDALGPGRHARHRREPRPKASSPDRGHNEPTRTEGARTCREQVRALRDSDALKERRCAPCGGGTPSVRGVTPVTGGNPDRRRVSRTEGILPSIGLLEGHRSKRALRTEGITNRHAREVRVRAFGGEPGGQFDAWGQPCPAIEQHRLGFTKSPARHQQF